jgi:subtilisin family serine protease
MSNKIMSLVIAIMVLAFFIPPAFGEEVYFPETNRRVTIEKDLSTETYIAIDEKGNRVDALPLMVAETAAKEAKYGKLGHNIAGLMKAAGKGDEFLVRIFLKKTPALADAVVAEGEIRAQKATMTARHYKAVLEDAKEVRLGIAEMMIDEASEAVEDLSGVVQSESATTHSFTAIMTKSAIQKLQKRSDVFKIYNDALVAKPSQDVAWRTMGASANWPYGIHGAGEKVAVVEGDSIITTNRPYINVLGVRDNSCPGDHATQVAHCIAAQQNHWTGIAYQASVVSANDCSWMYTGLANAVDWAYTNHAPDVYNHSYGGDTNGHYTSMDQFLDQHSADNFTFHVVAAGNSGGQCGNTTGTMQVSSPGLAYNVLTVGATNDNNTVPQAGDTMATFSCWENPAIHTSKEKPEVVAPGVNIKWKVAGPPRGPAPNIFQTNSGTSFASPLVAGVATLIEDAQSSCWWSVMSGHKAAILATAAFDIEAGRDKDGVGSVFAGTLPEVFNNAFSNCWATMGTDVDTDVYVDLQDFVNIGGSKKVRVALVWEEDPSGTHRPGMPYPDYPQNDWDLLIYDPDDIPVAGCSTVFDTWCVVEFTVDKPGTWRFFINNFGDSGISSKMAMVWAAIP